jgi:hypothetical protein
VSSIFENLPAFLELGSWTTRHIRFEDFPHLVQAAGALLDDIAWWAKALKAARASA